MLINYYINPRRGIVTNNVGGLSLGHQDEFHSRLRFVRRGLVAMANAGPHDNGSQFFFTMAATPELQNKHTIFGKVMCSVTVSAMCTFCKNKNKRKIC